MKRKNVVINDNDKIKKNLKYTLIKNVKNDTQLNLKWSSVH